MMLKLTEAVLNSWQIGKADAYVYVSFAPGVVAYMQRYNVRWLKSKPTAKSPSAVENIETECTLIRFNSATHDDINSVYVVETPEEIMARIPKSGPSLMQVMPNGSFKVV